MADEQVIGVAQLRGDAVDATAAAGHTGPLALVEQRPAAFLEALP